VSFARTLTLRRHPELVSGSIVKLAPPYRWQTQPHHQINPVPIFGIEQIDFPVPVPILQLLLARNGSLTCAEQFKVHKPIKCIFGSMARRQITAMFRKSLQQVRGHSDVKRATELACKNIYARLLILSRWRSLAAKWTLEQVQGDGSGGRNVG